MCATALNFFLFYSSEKDDYTHVVSFLSWRNEMCLKNQDLQMLGLILH